MIKSDELLFVVDENNQTIDSKPRNKVHKEHSWHRTSHVWILNSKKQLLCGKRSLLKDTSPGNWEPFFGGHLAPSTDYADGALIELKEELGITPHKEDLIMFKVYKNYEGYEFQGLFCLKWDGDIQTLQFEKEEIDKIEWVDLRDVRTKFLQDPKFAKHKYIESMLDWIETL